MMMVMIFLMQLRFNKKIQTLWGWRNTGRLQVDPAKLNTLKELIAGPDYKDNMQKIIRTIYEFAFMTYAGTTEYLKNLRTSRIVLLSQNEKLQTCLVVRSRTTR